MLRDIHFTCHSSSALWEWAILLSTRWCTATLPLRRHKLPPCKLTRSMYRTKR
jgi:hypothetical protein